MKKLPLAVRLIAVAAAVFGLLAYTLIVEWGLNAGQVHHGVTVSGWDVAGLTFDEAKLELLERRSDMRAEEICFLSEGFNPCASPVELGWFPDADETARRAYAVGRGRGLLPDIGDRITAWTSGYNVRWVGHARPDLVRKLINEWERELEGLGYTVDRKKLRGKVKRALLTYPRRPLRIPVS